VAPSLVGAGGDDRGKKALLLRDGQLRLRLAGNPRTDIPFTGRPRTVGRVKKVKGTSGAAGLQGVRASRSLAALKRQASPSGKRQPGDLILACERPITVWPPARRLQAGQESGSDTKCPGEPLGGKSSTPRWRLGRRPRSRIGAAPSE